MFKKLLIYLLALIILTSLAWAEDEGVALANPWMEVTAEELMELSGLSFGVPEGASDVVYRYMASENLVEMRFAIGSDEYFARLQPSVEWVDLSGMYFAWEDEQPVSIHHCEGTVAWAQTGSEDWTGRCLWFDVAPGLMGCLGAYTTHPEDVDLVKLSEEVYIPVQGNA